MYQCALLFKVIGDLVSAAEEMQVNDPNTLQLGISNMNAMAPTTQDMPVHAQMKLADIIKRTSDIFFNVSQSASREDSVAAGQSVLNMALNILNVSFGTPFEHPSDGADGPIVHRGLSRPVVRVSANVREFTFPQLPRGQVPHGWHTLDIECKGVLSTGVDRMLVGKRVGVGLTPLLLFKCRITGVRKTVLMVVNPLWRGLGILGFTQDGGSYRPGRLLLTSPVNPPFPV